MGMIGGGLLQGIKGFRDAPSGFNRRMVGSFKTTRMNAGRIAVGFAVWGGIFSSVDCTMVYMRQKNDPWNSIISGAATGAILSARAGPATMFSSALMGGVLLGVIEGANIALSNFGHLMMPQPPPQEAPMDNPILGLQNANGSRA